MTDLYEIMGVSKAANKTDLKRAYRARSKMLHPDYGGDPEKFAELAAAYTVLSNDEKRHEYDRTGMVNAKQVKNVMAAASQAICDMFNNVLGQVEGNLEKLDEVDIVGIMKESFKQANHNHHLQLIQIKRDVKGLEGLRSRIKRNDEEQNIFVAVLDAKIAERLIRKNDMDEAIEAGERAAEELEHYQSPVDLFRTMQGHQTSEWDSATSNGGRFFRVFAG